MEESGVEVKEDAKRVEIVDILEPRRYYFHWTRDKYLPKILEKGLYAKPFAERIGDKDYQSSGKTGIYVPFQGGRYSGLYTQVVLLAAFPRFLFLPLLLERYGHQRSRTMGN